MIRRARVRKGWRQADVEAACGVDQTTISLIEDGRIERCTVRTVRLVGDAVGIPLELLARISPAEAAQLLDEGHAALVELVLRLLHESGWETIAEFTFSHYGERGSVDIVAWHATTRTLLIVEIKTRLIDLQELLATLDRKVRLAPQLLARQRGWVPQRIARLLVVEEGATARRVVAEHRTIFDSAFPARSRQVRRWLATPSDPLSGLWFLSSTTHSRNKRRSGAIQRVRRPKRGRIGS